MSNDSTPREIKVKAWQLWLTGGLFLLAHVGAGSLFLGGLATEVRTQRENMEEFKRTTMTAIQELTSQVRHIQDNGTAHSQAQNKAIRDQLDNVSNQIASRVMWEKETDRTLVRIETKLELLKP